MTCNPIIVSAFAALPATDMLIKTGSKKIIYLGHALLHQRLPQVGQPPPPGRVLDLGKQAVVAVNALENHTHVAAQDQRLGDGSGCKCTLFGWNFTWNKESCVLLLATSKAST